MSTHCVVANRPEDRRRQPEPPMWADTLPGWFRSEAFVEDLPAPVAGGPLRFEQAGGHKTDVQQPNPWAAASIVLQQTRALWFFRPE